MLVLTRKEEEELIINGNIIVKVLEINGKQVRFGIAAPADVTIDRMEIHERKIKGKEKDNE